MSTVDQDLVRWGLHLLDGGGTSFYETGSTKPIGGGSASTGHVTTCSTSGLGSSTLNDEAIAHVLQEELTCLSSQEVSDAANSKVAPVTSIPIQDWLSQGKNLFDTSYTGDTMNNKLKETDTDFSGDSSSRRSYFDPTGVDRNDFTEKGGSASPDCSYQEEDSNDGAIAFVLSEDLSELDGEVRKRLTHMDSIPHIPKINGEIPNADDATLDHQRLLQRLELYGLSERKIYGDGNCQFRALSDQFYRTSEHHKFVRKEIVRQLKACPDSYDGYVPMKYSDYLKRMAKSGEWGDHVTLQAAADCYGVKICLITSFKDTCFIEIVPKEPKSTRVIFLSFWSEVHYNSIYLGDADNFLEPKKKKHWLFF